MEMNQRWFLTMTLKNSGVTELDLHKNSKDNNASWKDFQQMLWIKTDFQTKRFIFLNKVGLGRRKGQTDNPFPMPSSFSKSHVWSLQSCSTFGDPMDCSPPNSSAHGISQTRILGWLLFPSPGDLPNPGIKPTSPVSYIARIKPTSPVSPTLQGSNPHLLCLLHCKHLHLHYIYCWATPEAHSARH